MPNRIIRDCCKTSKTLAGIGDLAERTFWRIVTLMDDHGRYHGSEHALLTACYQEGARGLTADRFAAALQELSAADLIRFYEVDGRRYINSPTWGKHQRCRSVKSKFPDIPEVHDSKGCGHLLTNAPGVGIGIGDGDVVGGGLSHSGSRSDQAGPEPSLLPPPHVAHEHIAAGETPTNTAASEAPHAVSAGEFRSRPSAGELLERPPTTPEYVLSCRSCIAMLRTLNDSSGRFYNAPGRAGEWMHLAHDGRKLSEVLATIKRQAAKLIRQRGKARFLSPSVLFKPENWDTTINDRPAVDDFDELTPPPKRSLLLEPET